MGGITGLSFALDWFDLWWWIGMVLVLWVMYSLGVIFWLTWDLGVDLWVCDDVLRLFVGCY